MPKRPPDRLIVRINTPDELVWSGEVKHLTAQNTEGVFDILPFHANFTTIVGNSPITMETVDGQVKEFLFDLSVVHSKNNHIDIYANV